MQVVKDSRFLIMIGVVFLLLYWSELSHFEEVLKQEQQINLISKIALDALDEENYRLRVDNRIMAEELVKVYEENRGFQ
jgi:hypothetical protein